MTRLENFEQGLFGLNNIGIEFRSRGSGGGGGIIRNLRPEERANQLSMGAKIRHFQSELESKLTLRKAQQGSSNSSLYGVSAEQFHLDAQKGLTSVQRDSFNSDLTLPDED